MAWREHEARASVLERDAGPRNHKAAAKASVVGLDERNHHPVSVATRQKDGSLSARGGGKVSTCVVRVDAPRQFVKAGTVKQLCRRCRHPRGISDERVEISKS